VRVPNTASEALSTCEREQEKSVKSPIWNGRWRVVDEREAFIEEGRTEKLVRWDWIHFLVSRCRGFGREAKALSVC